MHKKKERGWLALICQWRQIFAGYNVVVASPTAHPRAYIYILCILQPPDVQVQRGRDTRGQKNKKNKIVISKAACGGWCAICTVCLYTLSDGMATRSIDTSLTSGSIAKSTNQTAHRGEIGRRAREYNYHLLLFLSFFVFEGAN